MAIGAGPGGWMSALMPLLGIVMILRNRSARRHGKSDDPIESETRTSAAEVQRRMAAYLASRDAGGSKSTSLERDEQENSR
jgi:hypothetical protein